MQFRGLVWHTVNEGKKSHVQAMQDAALGLVPGIPDLSVMRREITFFNELKVCTPEELVKIKSGSINPFSFLNKNQKEFHTLWNKRCPNNPIRISFPEFDSAHNDWLLQIRNWGNWIISAGFRITQSK